MKDVLVDSNVVLDIVTEDVNWFEWSANRLSECAEQTTLNINPIIYAEVSIGFQRIEELETALPLRFFRRLNLPWEAAFLAGKCFCQYRHSILDFGFAILD
ncbi:type II toxin-antitoxin system VapC family toxin [Brunnivagina elsteri]|uniref:DNA-binding protein n=1 Tax=Brunnivagina elsteri CCALA 953 TaxID=987040 RepID=A0A2A2TJ36_9CYAN|nr:PIN domain-containing protein [Calothrix elsteri]PAX54334.1 DNA-binding protein [Calothrix elsteri CCALA 953]